MTEYTYKDLLPVMRRIVADKGEGFVYEKQSLEGEGAMGCHYARLGEPDCGIGHLLHKLGVPVEHMGYGAMLDAYPIRHYYDVLQKRHSMAFTSDAQVFMEAFQSEQDEQTPWGDSLQYAVNQAERELNRKI